MYSATPALEVPRILYTRTYTLQVSFAKEPYKNRALFQMSPDDLVFIIKTYLSKYREYQKMGAEDRQRRESSVGLVSAIQPCH